jgi:hypothetical protein
VVLEVAGAEWGCGAGMTIDPASAKREVSEEVE